MADARAAVLEQRPVTPRQLALLSVVGFAAFIGIWWLASATGLVSRQFLPSPERVIETFAALTQAPFAGSTLQVHLLSSLERFALGFLLAAAIGIPLGLAMGWFPLLDDVVTPFFEALRFIAPIAWVPFAALWFGTGIGGPLLVIFTGAFPPCLINAYRGARLVDRRLLEAAQTLGASNVRIIGEVLLPGALPSIVAGLRISAGLGWQSLIGAELIVVSSGVGYLMVQGQSNINTSIVMAGMLAIGAVGFVLDVLLRMFEARVRREWGR
jgi:NitT/TauT family transport system permease protein